jgi:hypothetical protein
VICLFQDKLPHLPFLARGWSGDCRSLLLCVWVLDLLKWRNNDWLHELFQLSCIVTSCIVGQHYASPYHVVLAVLQPVCEECVVCDGNLASSLMIWLVVWVFVVLLCFPPSEVKLHFAPSEVQHFPPFRWGESHFSIFVVWRPRRYRLNILKLHKRDLRSRAPYITHFPCFRNRDLFLSEGYTASVVA